MADATVNPTEDGYHANVQVYSDNSSTVPRNRSARWIVVIVGSFAILVFGWMTGALFGILIGGFGSWIADLLGIAGFVGAGLLLSKLLPKKGFVSVPDGQAFITDDPLEGYYKGPLGFLASPEKDSTGNMVAYGPGLHPTFFWENRNVTGNHSTENVTKKFKESLPTSTSAVEAAVSLQYQADLSELRQFHLNDTSTIVTGIESFVRSFLSSELASMSADDAKNKLRTINTDLANQFGGTNAVTKFEKGYGIHITGLVIEGVDFPPKVQEARDARDEAMQMRQIVVEFTGLTEDEVREIAKNEPKRYDALLDKALVQSGNATMNVQVLTGTASDAVAAAFAGMTRGGNNPPSGPSRPRKNRSS